VTALRIIRRSFLLFVLLFSTTLSYGQITKIAPDLLNLLLQPLQPLHVVIIEQILLLGERSPNSTPLFPA
jgi:hypothetical protein